uniref:Uncharacterized protein n=1 Tax=Desulfovibrio sp. U5L TaxID=596152 RepID=I2Q4H3_9BACT
MRQTSKNTVIELDKNELSKTLIYMSPDEFREIWSKKSCLENSNDDALDKIAIEINSALTVQISYWFSVIKKTKIPEHITIQSYALYLIRQYIAVQYDMHIFSNRKFNQLERQSPTYKEYVKEHFPVASSTILGNIFMNCGEFWYIRYNDTCRTLKNYRGMVAIELLLANPRKELPFQEISLTINGDNPEAGLPTGSLGDNEEDPSNENANACYSNKIDDEARFAAENSLVINTITAPSREQGIKAWRISKQMKELQQKLLTSSPREKEDMIKKIGNLYIEKEQLETRSIGESNYIKIKNSVSKNISDTKKYFKTAYPDFYEHLKSSLKQSNHYKPKQEVFWHTKYTAKQFRESILGK